MSYQIELRHIRYFLAVAEELHFRKAAEKLFISQPGLSRQIKMFEEELGVVLFERHNRKVVLTKVGEYLKNEFRIQLKTLSHTLENAKLLHNGKKGELKIGYVGSAMQDVIPNLLLNFEKNHPDILFDLKENDNQKQIADLLSFSSDIGFVRLERVPRTLEKKTILKENFCLVLPEKHKINSENFESLKQFKEESFILFNSKYSASYYEKVMQIFDDCNFAPIISHNTIHSSSIFKLVEHNFGLSIVPKSLAKKRGYKIKFIELNSISQKTTLSVIWNKKNTNPILNDVLALL
ncbi:LysR substrate-binding domain-containing protein [Polaribacter sp. Z022]|uniref:LysR substrate-binding domain-containing protein n=1 Tax=Polaribacter sp. Z022 TaxID=2927125 RepID=UPI0020219464|nr:LysR substrate-binding domain-containing protein [Polaribacter sp. Z022]MCL7753955.1 LysR substrate-binding domain-containing protein [Polaribacter sp. Z022]